METITSLNNNRIVMYTKLNDKKYRDEYKMFLLENYKLAIEAISRGEDLVSIIIREDMQEKYKDIIDKVSEKIIIVPNNVFSRISDTIISQGIIAVARIKKQKLISDIKGKTLVLDRIQDAGNMGTLMRSAEGFGFENVILVNSVDPYNPKVIRSCGGSVFSLNILKNTENEVLLHAKSNNFAIFVADMDGKDLYKVENFPENTMVIIGNEGHGDSSSFMENSTTKIMIPMTSNLESLNAGVSGAIIMSYIHSKIK